MSGAGEGWRPMVSLAFRAVGGAAAYLDGKPAARVYVGKGDLKEVVDEYIAEGRLTLGEAAQPRLLEVEGGGGFYVALLEDPAEARPREEHTPFMHPFTVYDEERLILGLVKENRPHEFNELLRSYVKGGRRRIRPTWRELKPFSHNSAYEPGRPIQAGDPKRSRTALLLSGQPSMAEPWSLWGDLRKDRVAGFLAEALMGTYVNSALIRYGEAGSLASGREQKADLRGALREAVILNPERLAVLTDRLAPEPAAVLDALGRSGVRVLVIDLGDEDRSFMGGDAALQVLRLRAAGDLAGMMHGLAAWA